MIGIRRVIVSLSALFFGMSFIFVANGLVVSSAGLLLKNLNASEAMIGVVTSCFFIGALVCTLISHKLISKIGTFFIILGLIPLNLINIKAPKIPQKANISGHSVLFDELKHDNN
ncbi:hypothetical protein [Campylobacter iguaniorum]|uniref:hypothetical protein n=1 Tax=Campylobacter iguaniorum TaxID=1244531 RepID=UPI0007C89C53|nr:hypothetical protein [Campylobacter iguaniorum]